MMRFEILGSSGGALSKNHTTASLIDERILLDAGTGVFSLNERRLAKVTDIVLTHSHLDHTAMLMFVADYMVSGGGRVAVHCLKETADAIRDGFLNDRIWPDMENIRVNGERVIQFNIVKPYKTFTAAGRKLTPLPVVHQVPTVAYCLHGKKENFVFVADLYDAESRFWKYLNDLPRFRRMTLEVSFPDGMEELATASYHLTPKMFKNLMSRIPEKVGLYYCHVKPRYSREIRRQMRQVVGPRASPLKPGQVFLL
jgi:cAMP phosphodiesterase